MWSRSAASARSCHRKSARRGLRTLLENLYDHHPTLHPSDYEQAARQLLLHQRRRALVVLLTNLRGEDHADVLNAVRTLQRRHLVVLVSLREREVHQLLAPEGDGLSAALDCIAAHDYVHERARVLQDVASHGVRTLDVTAQDLPVALANAYLDAKFSGAL